MPDNNWKKDAFNPPQPAIPGVPKPSNTGAAQSAAIQSDGLPTWITLSIAGVLVLVIVAVWWIRRTPAEEIAPAQTSDLPAAASAASPTAASNLPVAPGEVATTDELASTWAAKKFLFHSTINGEQIPAMIVHLPGGTYWGFSLREPYGTCEMEWVTDLQKLETEYKYRAQHAMVADPCNHSVFDLTRYGSGPNGLVRGEIKQGAAVRPPIAIEIETKGKRLLATRME